jgi:hypothetical protein
MDWVQWIIPLIAIAVWILSNLARSKEDKPPVQRRSEDAPQPIRRSPEEVDRFLEEVRRRKRNAEGPKKPGRTSAPDRPRPGPPPLPRTPTERPRVSERPPPTSKPLPPPRRQEAEAIPVAEVLEVAVANQPPRALATLAAGRPTTVPPAVQALKSLLLDRQNVAAAIVLKEVLDQPLCKRPRRQ